MPKLIFYKTRQACLEVVPGRARRTWMDQTSERFAYRCLPLSVANSSGWEILAPCSFEAEWNGAPGAEAIILRSPHADGDLERFVASHFGHGILTFRPGYVVSTDPGWAVLVRGAPNFAIDGIQPLEGLVETDWLPFTFTMNWRFTRPGTVSFGKGDPIAFLTPIQPLELDAITPEIRDIESDPALFERFTAWKDGRDGFFAALCRGDEPAVRQGWQKDYHVGRHPDGSLAPHTHVIKRRLKAPRTDGDGAS